MTVYLRVLSSPTLETELSVSAADCRVLSTTLSQSSESCPCDAELAGLSVRLCKQSQHSSLLPASLPVVCRRQQNTLVYNIINIHFKQNEHVESYLEQQSLEIYQSQI